MEGNLEQGAPNPMDEVFTDDEEGGLSEEESAAAVAEVEAHLSGGQAPEAAKDEGSAPDDGGVDLAAIVADMLGPDAKPSGGREAWRGEAKAKLVAQGWDEKTAHQIAYHGPAEKARALLATSGDSSQDMGANRTDAPPVDAEAGQRLTEALSGFLDDSAAAKTLGDVIQRAQAPQLAAMQQELEFLRSQVTTQQAAAGTEELVAARDRLVGSYPEVNDPAAWKKLAPAIKAARASGLAGTLDQALTLALFNTYGARTGEPASKPETPSSVPTRPGKATPGARALTRKQIDAKFNKMNFEGTMPPKAILAWRRDALARLKD